MVSLDPGDLLRANPEARWASCQGARQVGVLSPNDGRCEEGWPASTDPTANSIEPPTAGGKPATDPTADDPSTPAPTGSRASTSGGHAMSIEDALSTPIPADPNDPEFDGVRADLARLFIRHKADLGMGDWSDAAIIANTNRIAGAIMACGTIAVDRGDTEWLERHRWFSDAAARLFADQLAMPLDG